MKRSIVIILFVLFSCVSPEIKKSYYEDGSIMEESTVLNGLKNGPYKYYYENGQIWAEGEFRKEKMNGKWLHYYEEGNIQSIIKYKNGKLKNIDAWDQNSIQVVKNGTGTAIWKYPDNTNRSQVSYKNSKAHGQWIMWHENGKKFSEYNYKNGRFDGECKTWNMDGSLKRLEVYKEGKLISKKEY